MGREDENHDGVGSCIDRGLDSSTNIFFFHFTHPYKTYGTIA